MKLVILRNIFWHGIDAVLPPRCPMTGELVDVQGMISPAAWKKLAFIADPQCECCGIPFEYGMEDAGRCIACIENPPVFGRARAALRYDEASRGLILGFKHGDKTYAVKSFMPMLRQTGRDVLSEADVLIPVPMHPYRLIRRRYNQAAMIAQEISKVMDIPHYPLALCRVRATVTQGHLNAQARLKNVKRAFAVHPKFAEQLNGKRVLLVDDVFTTGATVSECAKVLLKCGAVSVDVLTVARVVRT